jgi:N-acetylglucosamine-6-phosphate deacetylase
MPGRRWVIQAEQLLLPGGLRGPGFVTLDGDRIAAVDLGVHPRPDLEGGTLAPGFIDLQINGAAGCDFLHASETDIAAAYDYLLRTGTVAYCPTLISAPLERLRAALAFFAGHTRWTGAPRVLGVHLEGPFLARARAGAHRPAHLRAPAMAWIDRLLDEFPGLIRLVTLAPELDGALEVIDDLRQRGVVVAVGHTDATYDQAMAAFRRGARVATHLFNAMRPFHHREPGAVGAALDHPEVTCSLIADLVHVHPAVLRQVVATKTPGRTVLVTDALAAAGVRVGSSTLGDQTVTVADGAPRLADGTLAGSMLSMDRAVRNMVSVGITPVDALQMAVTTPARLLGLEDARIAPEARADLIVLDRATRVVCTIIGGEIAHRQE